MPNVYGFDGFRRSHWAMARTPAPTPMTSFSRGASVIFLLALLTIPVSTHAQEWTRFRGPNGTGISLDKRIPTTWSEQDFRWRVPIPGEGHSQPVIWGGKLFITSAVDRQGAGAPVSEQGRREGDLVGTVRAADPSSAEPKRKLRQQLAGGGCRARDRDLCFPRPFLGPGL